MLRNIERGAALLDSIRPDWFRCIDVPSLDMDDPERCILGQLFGHYDSGCNAIQISPKTPRSYNGTPGRYFGFNNEMSWSRDTQAAAWRNEIRTRMEDNA